jgi:tetratricopeptide (TPR) repeat protein
MNELTLRELLLRKLPADELVEKIQKYIADPSLSWDEKRPLWHYLYNTGRDKILIDAIRIGLENKTRVPFDLMIELFARANVQPGGSVLESLLKGLKKQRSLDEVMSSRGWDKWEPRLPAMRNELLEQKVENNRQFKENMIEKFEFLKNQRMTEQAGQVLKRLQELYPGDQALEQMQKTFDEEWARNVLSNHLATLQIKAMERTRTAPSGADQDMLKMFLENGVTAAFEHREFAFDLALAFWFMDSFPQALEVIQYAPPGLATDWMRAELLFAARHYLEALEQLNTLEMRYIEDPENTFAVSYLRAQCLFELGQHSSALEILQSIVRVRANYRSAHALILEWTAGVTWE